MTQYPAPISDAGAEPPASAGGSILNQGIAKREVWAWAMYDFAKSGYTTVVLTTVFSAYFVGVVAAQKSWGTLPFPPALSFSYLMIMPTMPTRGARADPRPGTSSSLCTNTADREGGRGGTE